MQCYKCQQMGYIRMDCSNKKLQIIERNDDSSKFANVVYNDDLDYRDGDWLSVSSRQTSDSWILDTIYSFHMTSNKD